MPDTSLTLVIAAVIKRAGSYLICQRPLDKRHGGLWEFPGGKLLEGETTLMGAKRELWEDLRLEVRSAGGSLMSIHDPGSDFVIKFCRVEALGEPKALEHIDVRWVKPNSLLEFDLAPSDLRFAKTLVSQSGD